jgi:hypothetical protein
MDTPKMKATLEYSLPEEREEMELAIHGWRFQEAVKEIWQECFRPAFKHGYADKELNDLLEKSDEVARAIELLSEIYRRCVRDLPSEL